MTNLIILLIVWCTGIVLVYAWMLARSLRRAFREEITVEPAEEHSVSMPAEGRVLSYAKPLTKISLTRRWPILSALIALGVLPIMALPLLPLVAATFVGAAQQAGTACAEVLGLTLLPIIVVAHLGLRDANGRPAAADWRKCGRAVLCWGAVSVVVWGTLAWRTQRIVDAQLAKADELGQRLEIRSTDGVSAAAIYRQAGISLPNPLRYEVDWEFMTSEAQVSPPSAVPEAHAFRVPLLRQAAAMQVGGLVPLASEYWVGVPLPHLAQMRMAANLLRQHAVNEARAGRIESAIADINAIHGLAIHVAQGLTIVESLTACGIHNVGFDTLQHVLPFVQDPKVLDRLNTPSSADALPTIRRAAQAEFGVADRRTLVRWLRADLPFGVAMTTSQSGRPGPPSSSSPTSMFFYRTALGEMECRTLDDLAARFPEAIPESPAAAAKGSAAVDAWMMSMRGRSILAGMMAWGIGRSVEYWVQVAARADLNRAAVASTRFRLAHGRLPASFEELVQAGLLPAVPVDPFDGKPLRFAAQDGYVFIYTIGARRTDYGGKPYILGRGGIVTESNPGFILSAKPLWELDLVPPGFVPATQQSEPQ